MVTLLKGLAEERIIPINPSQVSKLPFSLKSGVVRLVDKKGKTLGLIIDPETMEEIEEEIAASQPGFLASLKASRSSGRVSGTKIRKKVLG